MGVKRKNVEEQGLRRTEDFLKSAEFSKLCEKMKHAVEKYGDRTMPAGLTDEEVRAFSALCRKRFGCVPPPGYLAFLRVMNGYEFNAKVIYEYRDPVHAETHFMEDNARYRNDERLRSEDGGRKYLLIGREDEGYYGYNLQTGAYACLDNTFFDELQSYSSFADMLIYMMLVAFGDDEIYALFPGQTEHLSEEEPELTWYDSQVIAYLLLGESPSGVDVLSLTDDRLLEMLADEEYLLDVLPPLDEAEKADILFCIKCAMARLIEGDGKPGADRRTFPI